MVRFHVLLPLLSIGLVGFVAAQTAAVPTLKANTKIVVIDVVVTDKQGQPVKNLKASDFALAENGVPQTISHFDAHSSLSAEDAAKVEAMPKLAPNIFTNYSPVAPGSALNVLLFDSLNTHDKMGVDSPFVTTDPSRVYKDQSVVRQQMLKYLAMPHPGVRMEIFENNSSLRLLQGFTADLEVLRAALMNSKNEAKISQRSMEVGNVACDPDSLTTGTALEASGAAECAAAELQSRSLATLNVMAALAHYMGGLPGRKNLLWFSASFPVRGDNPKVVEKLHETMALFAKNQVAVYPIAAGGLMTTTGLPSKDPRGFLNVTDSENNTMFKMAEDTGGKVFVNSNDIAGAVDKAVENGSNYYTLTYTPANKDWKGEFRKVKVKLALKGYSLAYRPGYYAEAIAKADTKLATAEGDAPTADPARVALNTAMEYGSPQPWDVVLKIAVNPATGRPENTVAKMNVVAPKVSAPFERYVLSVAALPQAFTFTRDVPRKVHMAARLVTRVYSAEGELVNSTTLNVIGDIDEAHYQTIMQNGVQFRQEISVPVKGECFLRIGVEDLPTNHVGVVEIPVAMVEKLKPLMTEVK